MTLSRLSPYPLWLALSLPAFAMAWQTATSTNPRIWHILVHPSGEWAARLLVVTLLATPLVAIFRQARFPRWLRANRRYFGVAAFAYAALHTAFYLIDRGTLERVLAQLPDLAIWTGWLAFAIFIPLAATSTDWAVRRLGTVWKPLQRWTYAAAILTFVHWAALHGWGHPEAAMVHFAPLAALEAWRFRLWLERRHRAQPA